jgi:hypothetical protein
MRRIVMALVAAAAVAGSAGQAASAQAACTQWDLSYLQLKQTNGYIVGLGSQNGSTFKGRVSLSAFGPGWVRPFSGGYALGWTYQSRFTMTIYWDNGSAGDYDGTVYPNGWVLGSSYDRANRSSSAVFSSITNGRCRY